MGRHRFSGRQTEKATMLLPQIVLKRAKLWSVEQDSSLSWVVTEALMRYLGITQEQLDAEYPGAKPPMKKSQRKQWLEEQREVKP
jgi:hypothetical protein